MSKLEDDKLISDFLDDQKSNLTDFGYLLVADDPELNAQALRKIKIKFETFKNSQNGCGS